MNKSLKLSTAGLIAATLLSACGGGGGGSNTAANTVSQGTITGFGSVIVDGVRYSSVGALVRDDEDNLISRDDLRIGMTVNVEGTSSDDLASGEAKTIEVRRLLQGPVKGFTNTPISFTVLGQKVETTANTLIVGSLANDTNVKVYGLLQQGSPDKIIASRIEEATTSQTRFEAYGRVSSLNTTSKTFNIGTLNVTSTSLPLGLVDGSLVKVSCPAPSSCYDGTSTLAADKIKLRGARNDLSGQKGAVVKLKGVVDAVDPVNPNILTVAGIPVDISNAQREDDDASKTAQYTPTVGDRIEIKGSYNDTTLIARKIEQEGYRESKHEGTNSPYSTELYGIVEANSNACASASGDYLVQAVCVNDGISNPAPTPGTYVEVKGNMSGDVLVAVEVEAKSGSKPTGGYIEIKGTISAIDKVAKTFSLDTLTVNYANATVEEESLLDNGRFVEVKGTKDSPNTFKATKVDVEDNRD